MGDRWGTSATDKSDGMKPARREGEGEDGEAKAEEAEKKPKARDLGKLSQSSGLSKLKRGREIPRRGGS